ncbi:hotdog fold thioesterase [Microbacterium xanthum]|uniref:hotdog fold thioesterase n=1 Tax=Microbacterium xanthum TaxID=3079794 RepID=UPI002AD51480|nr:hotdog fold thioesterase [Microbacterium sp. KSW-48]MDZ8170958.1 hotdog fold thioesterase [Microbacterium sp. KSW-48]
MVDAHATAHSRRIAAEDGVIAALGIRVDRAEPGYAAVRMTVRRDMVNGAGVTHGGMVFALADTAIALASNDTAEAALVAGADVVFLASSAEGDELVAIAEVRAVSGRTGVYDARVEESGRVIAEIRGRVRRPRESP